MQLCALGAVHVFLLHAALRASCFPCEWIEHCHRVVILLLCGISSCFASYQEDVAVVMRIGSTHSVTHKGRVFAASREHTLFVTCIVTSVPQRKKIYKKREREEQVRVRGCKGGGERRFRTCESEAAEQRDIKAHARNSYDGY